MCNVTRSNVTSNMAAAVSHKANNVIEINVSDV